MERFSDLPARVNYARWLIQLIAWDGILPILIVMLPFAIELVLPNRRGAIELAAVAVPIVAFFVRLSAGWRHIAANHCHRRFQSFQKGVLFFAVFVLVFIDAVWILSHIMPRAAFGPGDLIILLVLAATYFGAMAIAMYPGAEPRQSLLMD